jgi:hypothetical protein
MDAQTFTLRPRLIFFAFCFLSLFVVSILPHTHSVTATPIPKGSGIDHNIEAILPALSQFTIQPGEEWSFNEAVGHPDRYQLVTVYGVYGGGWCDVASRYAELARKLGLERTFVIHSTPLLRVERQDNVSIWNETGMRGQLQDLLLRNTSDTAITFSLLSTVGEYQLIASSSHPFFLQGSRFTMR